MLSFHNLVTRFVLWISDAPRVNLPTGQELPQSWLADCVASGTPAPNSNRALTPDFRQCEPWRGAPVTGNNIFLGATPHNAVTQPSAVHVATPAPSPSPVRSLMARGMKSKA